jgi:hypothetical protein
MALLGRFSRGLAEESSPDPLDLDGARPSRAVSKTAPGGPCRALDFGVLRLEGRETRLAPIRRSGSRGLVPLVENSSS